MNSDKKKKMVAALSGVMQYLEEEKQQSVSMQSVQAPQNSSSAWTSYGRQTTMMNAQMMQRRVVRR
jgi:O-methyltransferase involved in polyketide biosynthesis